MENNLSVYIHDIQTCYKEERDLSILKQDISVTCIDLFKI